MTSDAAGFAGLARQAGAIRLLNDPRTAQMAMLGTILAAGAYFYDFALDPRQTVMTFAAALLAQAITDRISGREAINYRSALITALSIVLLLRADSFWVHPAAAVVAIGSKSLLRVRGKHLFNPSCFGVIVALLAMPGVWVSPGQWGDGFAIAGWIAVAGTMVVSRARGLSSVFILFYGGAMLARVLWLGQRLAVFAHRMASGSLLLFAFFMISDPRTSPDDWRGRIAHSAVVAGLAFVLGTHFYANNSLIWALFLAAPAVPLWDTIFQAPRFDWETKGESDVVEEDPNPNPFPSERRRTELRGFRPKPAKPGQAFVDYDDCDKSLRRTAPADSGARLLRLLRWQGGGHAPQQDLEGRAGSS
jgi:Na+-transporting NADH:ubiquinone oxidoreductase subunit NqrB